MSALPVSTTVAYLVTFDRIGRTRDVPALQVDGVLVDAATHVAEAVYRYARPFLVSRHVEVVVDLPAGKGTIFCGFQSGGTFTVEPAGGES